MNEKPLMPKATAVWLIDNTGLTFDQISSFTGLHVLEIKGIADGEVATGIRGLDPVGQGILTRAEIDRCANDPKARLQLVKSIATTIKPSKRREPKYTPLSKRQDRPDGIAWLLRHHPELSDKQVCRLLGTTKNTLQQVRDRTHWKSQEIRPRDPVLLGLCQQIELDEAVATAKAEKERNQPMGAAESVPPATVVDDPVQPAIAPEEQPAMQPESVDLPADGAEDLQRPE